MAKQTAPNSLKAKVKAIKKTKWYNQYHKKYTEDVVMQIANDMVEYFQTNLDAIHFVEFCADYTINKTRLHEFRKQYSFFNDAYELCRTIITKRWIAMGKKNDAKNQAFVIFGLKNVDSDDFKDKQEYELSGGLKNTNTIELLSDEEREKRKQELLEKLNK